MDPAGIREIYLVRPYVNNPYQVESVSAGQPFKTRVHAVYAANPWLPFSEPLTQRVSRASEGYAGWLQYDCAVLAGIDLQCGTERDVQNIRSAAERGLPLMLCGGACGLGSSYRLWHDLEGVLPAAIPAGEPIACDAEVEACSKHPILRGLPRSFGKVQSLHPVEVHDNAEILLHADGKPVLVASERAGGRQLILAVAAADGLCCDPFCLGGFYGHAFYADLMRNSLRWLMGVDAPIWFDALRLETRLILEAGDEHVVQVAVAGSSVPDGARVRCATYALDEALLASGGRARRGEHLADETVEIERSRQRMSFSVPDAHAGRSSGIVEVELALEIDDPPKQPPKGCFGMGGPPAWNNWKGKAVDVRRFRLRFPDRRRSRVFVPGRTFTLEQDKAWRVSVETAVPAVCRLEIHDRNGHTVGEARSEDGIHHDLRWVPESIADTDYTARIVVKASDETEESFSFALKAVRLADPDADFHVVGHGGAGVLNDDEIETVIRSYREEFGLDTISRGLLRDAELFEDPELDWSAQPFVVRRQRWVDALLASWGRHMWDDFDRRLILLETHGSGTTYAPTKPCVLAPDYEAAVRKELAPSFRLMAQRAGLISTEIIDEPHLYPSNVCRCEICEREYRERFGEPMPQWSELEGDQTERRWHFFQWLEDYTTRAFAATMKLKREIAPDVHIHNVAIDRHTVSNFMFNGMHRWAEYGDELYMACYPWSYLSWRGWKQMPHSQTHWIASWIRGLATHYDIPWGVFMELWEHDVPNRWLPPYWSVGQFYSLLAEGARRMDTFLVSFGSEVFGISFERLREFGREVNKIRPHFPLVASTRRPRARMVFVNPWAEWVMNPQEKVLPPDHEGYGYYRRYAIPFDRLYPNDRARMLAYELFHRAFTDLDQMDENLLCEEPLDYQAIVLCDCTFLMQRTAQALLSFVENGGTLILDRVPVRDEQGRPAEWFAPVMSSTPMLQQELLAPLSVSVREFGQGRLVLFSHSLQTFYADVAESGKAGARKHLEQAVAGLLDEFGLHSRFRSSCGDIAVGVRFAEDACLVPVANTVGERRAAEITLTDLPFAPTTAEDLTDGSAIQILAEGGQFRFRLALDGYHGALIALRQ